MKNPELIRAFRAEIAAAKNMDDISNLYMDLNDYEDGGFLSVDEVAEINAAITARIKALT